MREEKPSQNVEIARALSVGLTWALSTALFLYLGSLVDGWLGSKPVFTLIGAFIGAAAGFYYIYRQIAAGPGTGKGSGKSKDGDAGA
ncbi:MAG TPA: AtpZ/AtpI family protein [Longimicrobiales bacterium]